MKQKQVGLTRRHKQLLEDFVRKKFQKAGLDYKSFDLKAYTDSSLSYGEAKQEIADKLALFIKEAVKEKKREHKEHEQWLQEKQRQEYEEKVKIEFEKNLGEIAKHKDRKKLEEYFKVVKNLLKTTLTSKNIHSCILMSEAGFGKTYMSLKTIKELGYEKEMVYLNSYSTPLSFYSFLFENQNKICVLDDVEGIFNNSLNVSILKSALWGIGNKRIVNYLTSKKLPIPNKFEFRGKIICLANAINLNDENVKAVIDRGYFYHLQFSYKDKIRLLYEMAKEEYGDLDYKQRLEVVKWIKENTTEATINLNFRTLPKLYALYQTNKDWKELAKEVLRDNETLAMVREAVRSSSLVKEQVSRFIEMSGLSRRTFFNYKKLLYKR